MTIALPETANPPEHYRLHVPATAGWLTANMRGAWYTSHQRIRHYRNLGFILAKHAGLPRFEQVHIVAELRFRDARRRRDAANWSPTSKAVLDGIVDAGVLADDSSFYVTGPDMRIGPVSAVPAMIMHIWPGRS